MRPILFIVVGCTVLGLALGYALAYNDAHGPLGQEAPQPVGPVIPEPPPEDQPQPQIEIDNEVHDFGEIERYGSGEHSFIVTNTGEGDLELQQGDTTCKCTISDLTNRRIAPGQSALVTLSWTAETNSDYFEQSAEIWTNDRRRRHVILKIKGKITQPLVVEPDHLVLGDVLAGESKTARLECYVFRDAGAGSLRHALAHAETADYFEVTREVIPCGEFKKPKAKHGYRISVTAKPGLPLGPIQQTIRLSIAGVEGEDVQPLDVPVFGRVVSDFSFAGGGWDEKTHSLPIGLIEAGQQVERTLIISVRGPHRENMEINVEEVYPELLDVTIKNTPAKKSADVRLFPLVVKIPRGQPAGDYRGVSGKPGKIVLTTNHPQVTRIEILVKFLIE